MSNYINQILRFHGYKRPTEGSPFTFGKSKSVRRDDDRVPMPAPEVELPEGMKPLHKQKDKPRRNTT